MVNEIELYNTAQGINYKMNNDNATFLITDGSVDWGEVSCVHHTYNFPTQIGQFLSSTTIGTRGITIFGWIVGGQNNYADLKRKKSLLNAFISPLQPIEIRVGEYKITGIPESQVKYSKEYIENNEVMCKFLINLLCINPLFQSVNPIDVKAAQSVPKFMFPLAIPSTSGMLFGLRESSLFSTIINTGSIPIGIIVTFEANGVVNNPKLFDVKTLEFLKLNYNMATGDKIIISTVDGDRYVKAIIADVEYDYFDKLDIDSSWLQLSVGSNTIGYKTDIDGVENETYKNLSVTISYSISVFNIEEE